MNRNNFLYKVSLICISVIFLVTFACTTEEEESSYSQDLIYSDTVWGIMTGIGDIYNQNLAGKPVGYQNISTFCPLGGNVTITGTTGYSSTTGITTVTLNYSMTNCVVSHMAGAISATLTLDGTLDENGSFSDDFTSLTYLANNLSMSGTLQREGYPDGLIDEICDVNINRTSSGVSAEICDTMVSW